MYCFDSSNEGASPALRVYLNLGTLLELPPDSSWPGLDGRERMERLAADGFEGVQLIDDGPAAAGSALPHCGLGRVNVPADAEPLVARSAARGDQCLTVHAGWGIEDDDTSFALVEAILTASAKHSLPVFIETHRATITQDLWRTVKLTEEFPEIRFNADLSHYYTGLELVYGGLEMKLDFMAPIFERTGFIHGRIGSPGCMQVAIGDGRGRPVAACGEVDFLADFREMWTRAMRGFLRGAAAGEFLVFAPELLPASIYYARGNPRRDGAFVEESDRYREALAYQRIARECFAAAHAGTAGSL